MRSPTLNIPGSKRRFLVLVGLSCLFFVIACFIFLNLTILQMLQQDAHRSGIQWVEIIEGNLSNLDIDFTEAKPLDRHDHDDRHHQHGHDHQHGQGLDVAETRFFNTILSTGKLYHIDLFSRSGKHIREYSAPHHDDSRHADLKHDHHGTIDLSAHHEKLHLHRNMVVRVSRNPKDLLNIEGSLVDRADHKAMLENHTHAMQVFTGDGVSQPFKFAEIYHPLFLGEEQVGMARVLVNLTTNYYSHFSILMGSAGFVLAMLAVGFCVPFYHYMRTEKQKRIADEKAHFLAWHDPLTSLANRARFDQIVQGTVTQLKDQPEKYAIHYIDVDLFKEVNDVLGHDFGDELLKAVAQRLCMVIRENDVVARIGGDEFAALQRDIQDETDAEAVAKRITAVMKQPFEIFSHKVSVSASVGVAIAEEGHIDHIQLKKKADIALYWVKNNGRNGHKIFSDDIAEELIRRKDLERTLRAAIENGELELHFQPQVNRASKEIVGYEALLRLRDQNGDFIPPNVFIPIAEEIGLIVEIGHWVIRQATMAAAAWPESVGVAINLSPKEFSDEHLIDVIGAALDHSGISPTRLEIEVTEGLLLENTGKNLQTLQRIKDLGVSIAIDDFGTGYSSLSYLWRFPFDKVKIDRSFMQANSANQSKSSKVMRTIIALGHAMDMKVLAEGVETLEQLELLDTLQCDEVQGYHLGRPMPENEITAFTLSHSKKRLVANTDVPRLPKPTLVS